ncbi:hypothetical protein HMPREF0027_0667 [Actinobacillus ureae ATCC 25976]|uniref:Uncharacterized protein n=1 Tax=Actinobacillus ureae ATCC 25976 TaxID=887324 RepID=E8KFQ0_9PAST|nr:hypothetical protein HMPREF0027_0667 [Actinobacillus ureae ATCC 25976]
MKYGIARRECFEKNCAVITKMIAILFFIPNEGIRRVGFNIFTPKNLLGWYLRVAINLSCRSRRIILTKQTIAIKLLIKLKMLNLINYAFILHFYSF